MLSAMGVTLPPPAMAKFGPAIASGTVTPEMGPQLGAMLKSQNVPPAKIEQINAVMSGTATNTTMADLLSDMSSSNRNAVMSSLPVTGGNLALGAITHFALSALLGMLLAMMIVGVGIQRLSLGLLRTPAGIAGTSMLGASVAYAVNRWIVLPAIDPLMRLVPQTAFFVGHLLFGLVVGLGITLIARREGRLPGHDRRSGAVALA